MVSSAVFSDFIAAGVATAPQIEFINMIIEHLTDQGVMDPGLLYESSFTYVAPTGPEQLFGEEKVTQTVRQDRRNKSKCRGLDTR